MSMDQDTNDHVAPGSGGKGAQYLTFFLAGEEYGVDILRVQEIKGWDTATYIPNTPSYIKGVINLRGTIVPLFDLRERFGLEAIPYGPTTVVIVLNVESEDRTRVMGIVVDAVSDVYNVSSEHQKPPPDFGGAVTSECVEGLATVEDKMVILLNIEPLLSPEDLSIVDEVVSQEGASTSQG